jgi:phospholipid transport system transporter-binding protein
MSRASQPSPQINPDGENGGGFVLTGELVFDTVPGLLESGRTMFDTPAATIGLDLRRVSRADSAGLALLVEWLRAARRCGKSIVFRNIPGQLLAIAKVSGLDALLDQTQ